MTRMLKTLPHSKRVKVWVYQDDPAHVDALFESIGLGGLSRHQQYNYMAQCTAKMHKVKLPTGAQ